MNITSVPGSAVSSASSSTSDAVNIAVLKKALNAQVAGAVGILQSIPQPANVNIGRNVNTVA